MNRFALPRLFVFVRHAIAADAEVFDGPDSQRPLTAKGTKRAQAIFRRLVTVYQPTRVLASPYVRAVETARLLIQAGNQESLAIEPIDALTPDGRWDDWRKALLGLQPGLTADDVVAVVGHEPTIGLYFARHLGLAQALPFKKAGVGVVCPQAVDQGELVAFVPPKIWCGDH